MDAMERARRVCPWRGTVISHRPPCATCDAIAAAINEAVAEARARTDDRERQLQECHETIEVRRQIAVRLCEALGLNDPTGDEMVAAVHALRAKVATAVAEAWETAARLMCVDCAQAVPLVEPSNLRKEAFGHRLPDGSWRLCPAGMIHVVLAVSRRATELVPNAAREPKEER